MTQHLFLFTIGPVQSFISQARKTVDLKAGSDILSKLILKAIEVAKTQYQAEIIFPHIMPGAESMPNKFLAQVPIAPSDCKAMGKVIQKAVDTKWEAFGAQAWENMKIIDADDKFQERFDEQIRNSLEVYWVFEPLPEVTNYRQAYLNVEAKLSAIKNTRAFIQLPYDESGRKCSVTGERDALVFNKKFYSQSNGRPPYANAQKTKLIRKSPVHLGSGEGLSAVAATKRFYQISDGFHSTAGIATKAFLNKAESSLSFQLQEYRGQFGKDDWDEQLLYPENLTNEYFNKHLSHPLPNNITPEVLRNKLKALWAQGKALGISTRTPYYALLSFDGDQMGKIWSGDVDYLNSNADLKSFQKILAKLLAKFAGKARVYLDQEHGQTVYAGGDDFTGFINLHYLFEVLQYLRTLFRDEVSLPMLQAGLCKEISFSAGICIAHYKTPLSEVVRNAHLAQDYAKDDAGRNAYCIHVMKRSGEVLRASMPWGTQEEELQNWKSLYNCVYYMQQGCFSNTFITSIVTELLSLMGRKGDLPDEFLPMIEAELKRLIHRAKIEGSLKAYLAANPQETAASILYNMQKAVIILLKNSPQKKQSLKEYEANCSELRHENGQQQYKRLLNTLNLLQIADFLNRQPDHAN